MSTQRHRGPRPEDAELFHRRHWETLRAATCDLSYLLSRDYAPESALKIVGDRYQLRSRQRLAVRRCAAGEEALRGRRARRAATLPKTKLAIDAFNQLITLETGLGGGVLLRGRDGVLRDLAGVHGTWRRGDQSERSLRRLGEWLVHAGVRETLWLVDRPVSNSGRLRELIEQMARARGLPAAVEVVGEVDERLIAHPGTVVSSDSRVLDRCRRWVDLLNPLLERDRAWIVDLGAG